MKKNKTSSYLKEFAKKHWLILAVLTLLPIAGVVVYCIVFKCELLNAGAWGSIIAGIFTYFGTITLGVFTFFHAWQQEKIQAELKEAKISLSLDAFHDNDYYVPYSEEELNARLELAYKSERFGHSTNQGEDIKDWSFLGFTLKNINHLVSIRAKIIGIYFVTSDHTVQEVKSRIKIWNSGDESPIDYKQIYSCYIGCDANILSKKYMEKQKYFNCFIVFSITDDNNKVKYVICDYALGHTFGVSKSIISEKDFQKRMKVYGSPIILTAYNRQFFN